MPRVADKSNAVGDFNALRNGLPKRHGGERRTDHHK
jgi:hypothetical protein